MTAPNCYVEVYDQQDLRRGHLVAVPQLLQCWTGGLLKRERVCNWLSLDLGRDVSDVYIQHWSLSSDGLIVKLLLFDEARARQEGSPFRNGARVLVCCGGQPLYIDAASRIQALCPAHPVCRALTQGLLDIASSSGRTRECAARRAEIWTIVDQLRSVVQWTEEALKRCGSRGSRVNSECLILAYHLLVGLSLGTESLERLDAAREQLRQEYTAIRHGLCGLNLHIARLFENLQSCAPQDTEVEETEEEDGSLYMDMLHVAGRVLTTHSKIVRDMAGSCLPLERLDAARSHMAFCMCFTARATSAEGKGGAGGAMGEGDAWRLPAGGAAPGEGSLPSRPPGSARASAERMRPRLKEEPPPMSAAASLQVAAQADHMMQSARHL